MPARKDSDPSSPEDETPVEQPAQGLRTASVESVTREYRRGRNKYFLHETPRISELSKLPPADLLVFDEQPAKVAPIARVGNTLAADPRILNKDGVKFVPLSLAAWLAQTSETTLRTWIDKKIKFQKQTIKTFHSPATAEIYISQESLAKIAERFVKFPGNMPAGPVTIGETQNHTGYFGLPDAARTLGISSRTMWLWATQGKAPISKELDVIRCTTSDHFYINERDVRLLQKVERPKGLRRGPKPRSVSRS